MANIAHEQLINNIVRAITDMTQKLNAFEYPLTVEKVSNLPARTIVRTLLGSTLLLISSFSTADVRVELSSDSIRQDETVQLHLKADGVDLQPPDLSVLDADFSIVDRHVQRSRSTINGRRRERIGLTLILLPKRTGSLKIPAISFGA